MAKTKRKLSQEGVVVFKDDTFSVIEVPTKYCRKCHTFIIHGKDFEGQHCQTFYDPNFKNSTDK